MKSLLHSKYCLNAKTQKKNLIFFCVKVTSVKIKNHHSIILDLWMSPWLTQLIPMTQSIEKKISQFCSVLQSSLTSTHWNFCQKYNLFYRNTIWVSLESWWIGLSEKNSFGSLGSIVWVRGTFKNPKWLSDGFWFLQTSLWHKKN